MGNKKESGNKFSVLLHHLFQVAKGRRNKIADNLMVFHGIFLIQHNLCTSQVGIGPLEILIQEIFSNVDDFSYLLLFAAQIAFTVSSFRSSPPSEEGMKSLGDQITAAFHKANSSTV